MKTVVKKDIADSTGKLKNDIDIQKKEENIAARPKNVAGGDCGKKTKMQRVCRLKCNQS